MIDDVDELTIFVLSTAGRKEAIAVYEEETGCNRSESVQAVDRFSHQVGCGWRLSKQIKELVAPVPVILAGGLKPENVKEAILAVKPFAVDVASGVEGGPGVKDHGKIRAFVENAKQIKLDNN